MMRFSLAITLLSAQAGLCSASPIAAEFAQDVTIYHLNPLSAGSFPLNMNSGDALGDLGFYLLQFLLPMECSPEYLKTDMRSMFDCSNAERMSADLVVTKVDMTIDSRTTEYSACNACKNGIDPATGAPCAGAAYVCGCIGNLTRISHEGCAKEKVGMELITQAYPNATTKVCAAALDQYCGDTLADPMKCVGCTMGNATSLYAATCSQTDWYNYCKTDYGIWHTCPLARKFGDKTADWVCWADNMPFKTKGHWYATQQEGLCNETSAPGSCSWKVYATKTIKNSCLKEKIVAKVVSADPDCFAPYTERNSTGWIQCFYDTVLGKEASKHLLHENFDGIPAYELEKVWVEAFLPEAQGGCPTVDTESQLWEEDIGQRAALEPQPLVSHSQVPWFLVAALSVMVLVMMRINCQLKQRLRTLNYNVQLEAE